jgi:hypothetical protein
VNWTFKVAMKVFWILLFLFAWLVAKMFEISRKLISRVYSAKINSAFADG